jgi:hypothetical protein
MKKKLFRLIIIIAIILIGSFGYKVNNTYASYISSDIDGIDTSKYPGYKEALQKIKQDHPNWTIKLLYTGLDWDYAVESERTGHGSSPKSLIQNTYNASWFCYENECVDQSYDVSQNWKCASKTAIAYMMDPRNSLDEGYIFQFQNLDSSTGLQSEIATMVKRNFLRERFIHKCYYDCSKYI